VRSAIRSHASDVHIEPLEKGVLVRHRLDGLLKEVMDLPKWVHEGLIARLKIMAGMDIAEKRLPQDGRIRITTEEGTDVDFRASTLRTLFGEKVVLRVLDHRKGVPPLEELGFSAASLDELKHFLRHQHGMILVVGPTGSGKTTTLCSALTTMKTENSNIITIEDPVEYQLPGINQTQINDKIKLTFASALRSILRQDPDVILVGEMRDLETIETAILAAETGHLVLSTIHTVDASESVNRIIDFFPQSEQRQARAMLGGTLKAVVSQRLVPTADGLGRIASCEILRMTGRVRDMIINPEETGRLHEVISEGAYYGMQTFDQALLEHVQAGRVAMDQALKAATHPHDFKLLVSSDGQRHTSVESVFREEDEAAVSGAPGRPGR
jgi:pilus retraction protein PilT